MQAERAAPWIVGAAFAAPVVIARYPPMGDLAFHEAMVATMRHFGDASWFPPGLYAMNLGQPNQLFHLAAAALSFVVPTDVACKLVIAATVIAIVAGASRLAAHAGASRWASLIVAPIALGWTFQWGLVANLTGLALLLVSLPALDRLAEEPTARRAAIASAAAVAIHFAHESSAVIFAAAAVLFALARPMSPRSTMLRLLPAIVTAALVLRYIVVSERLKAPSIRVVPTTFVAIDTKVMQLPGALFGGGYDVMITTTLLALVIAATLLLVLQKPAAAANTAAPPLDAPPTSTRDTVHSHRFFLLGIACFIAYLAMPLALNGSTLVYHRFLAPAYALVVIGAVAGRASRGAPRPAAIALACALPLAVLLPLLPRFAESARTYRDLDALLPLIEKGSAVAQLDLSPRPPSVVAPIPGAGARALAERGGRLLFSFTDAPAAPVTTTPELQWNEPVLRLTHKPLAFLPAHDLQRFRYVLVRQTDADSVGLMVSVFEPEAKLVARSGQWMLFESTLTVVPLASPDVALPTPTPATLHGRIMRILREQRRVPE